MLLFQIQHPRSHLDRFDMVITPKHDYYPLTSAAQEQVPRFLRRWITPHEPPGRNVVSIITMNYLSYMFLPSDLTLHLIKKLKND